MVPVDRHQERARQLEQQGHLCCCLSYDLALLQADPDQLESRVRALQVLLSQGQLETAAQLAAPLLAEERQPLPAKACQMLGELAFRQGRYQQSAHWYQRSLESPGDEAEGLMGWARALRGQDRLPEAHQLFQQACCLEPNHAWARLGKAEMRLAMGQLDRESWDEYEARFEVDGLQVSTVARGVLEEFRPTLAWTDPPLWEGQPLPQSTLLVWKEQGDGDFFQFVRYLPRIRPRVGRLVLACRCSLRRLAARVSGVDMVLEPLGSGFPRVHVDAHVPLLSLTRWVEGIPPVPYLQADPREVKRFRKRWARFRGLKVGLVWAGQRLTDPEPRSLALQALAPLGSVQGVQFFSLQKGPDALQASWPPPGMPLVDLNSQLLDWASTAAALSSLDLLITVDSGIAHLAGGLGVPTWVLLQRDADWRWQRQRSDSPWYPSLRLYRQSQPGCWRGPVEQVAEDLARLV